MNKICTTLEESKKLIELGIDVNTADMYWLNRYIDLTETKYELFVVDRSNERIDFFNSYAVAVEKGEIIPAWSLSALLELIPERIPGTKLVIKWDGSYYIEDRDCLFDNAIDAAFEMVCWLKENGKI